VRPIPVHRTGYSGSFHKFRKNPSNNFEIEKGKDSAKGLLTIRNTFVYLFSEAIEY
jgi:hypothetical protein